MSTSPDNLKILHTWPISVTRTFSKTAPEQVNGQTLSVTREVTEPVITRFALRDLTRKERRAADLFLASRTAHYVKDHGLLLASELTNRLINTTGGVLTDKEKTRVEELRARHAKLDMDLALTVSTASPEEKDRLQKELTNVRAELINLNAINEAVYSQTAEAKAQTDQSNWIIFHTIMIERSGRWQQYFEGDTFEKKEAAMWALEEANDELYNAALSSLSTFAYWFGRGVDTPEGFKLIQEEIDRQAEARKAEARKDEEAKDATLPPPPENPVTEPTSPDVVPQAVSAPVPVAA